jgi:hypothetical protein
VAELEINRGWEKIIIITKYSPVLLPPVHKWCLDHIGIVVIEDISNQWTFPAFIKLHFKSDAGSVSV